MESLDDESRVGAGGLRQRGRTMGLIVAVVACSHVTAGCERVWVFVEETRDTSVDDDSAERERRLVSHSLDISQVPSARLL